MADKRFDVSVVLGVVDKASAQLQIFEKHLNKNEKAMEGFKKAGLGLSAMGAAGAASIVLLTNKASDLQEQQSKFNVVMGSQLQLAEKWAKEMVQSYAMSELEAKKYMATVQDMLKPMGMTEQAAASMSNEIVRLAADLGSFNNLKTGDVMRDIQSALAGQTEPMRKYGVMLNETRLKQEALNLGFKDTGQVLDPLARAQAAYSLIVKGSKDAIGDMARTADGYANTSKRMQASIENMQTSLGQNFIPIMTKVVETITKASEAFNNLSPETKKMITNFILYGTVLAAVIGPMLLMVGNLPKLIVGVQQLGAAIKLLATTTSIWTVGIIAAAIAAERISAALLSWADNAAKVNAEEAKSLKTLDGKIKLMEDEKAKIIEQWREKKITEEEAIRLLEKRNATIKLLKEKQAEQHAAELANKAVQNAAAEETFEIEKGYEEALYKYKLEVGLISLEQHKKNLEEEIAKTKEGQLKKIELMTELHETEKKISENRKKQIEQEKDAVEKAEKKKQEAREKTEQNYLTLIDRTKSAMTNLYEWEVTKIQNQLGVELSASERKYQERKQYIERNVADESERTKQLQELEKAYHAETENLKNAADAEERRRKKSLKPILVAEAVANTYLAATKALAQGGIFGYVGAAAIIVAGMAKVQQIQAQQFARGVRNFAGGWAITGEEGPELVKLPAGTDVIPHRQSMQMLAGAGGPNVTVNISGTFVGMGGMEKVADMVGNVIMRKVKNQRTF